MTIEFHRGPQQQQDWVGLGEGGLLVKNNEGAAKPAVQGGRGGADASKNSVRLGGI